MTDPSVAQAVIDTERAAVVEWAARTGWEVGIDNCSAGQGPALQARIVHPITRAPIVFHAALQDYPVLPPAWTCRDRNGAVSAAAFPLPGSGSGLSSIFHGALVICAPWNRLAYGAHGGPHRDWTDLTAWKGIGGNVSQAHTLGDMLATIALHLSVSPGTAA
ncbi:hypothetical protein [Mycobacterium asiaticum]|uniref:Uncharacterized protein n=1 Tax=Mycobacterium asiaticum TaxID=1790 RepID=A0A1A3NRN5_MYCAS|nr:hypothetical protein [Mycobacterium asiaticum]OBK22992.1 hypothetical protein A5635_20375 [Mycobacterium asiaticum]